MDKIKRIWPLKSCKELFGYASFSFVDNGGMAFLALVMVQFAMLPPLPRTNLFSRPLPPSHIQWTTLRNTHVFRFDSHPADDHNMTVNDSSHSHQAIVNSFNIVNTTTPITVVDRFEMKSPSSFVEQQLALLLDEIRTTYNCVLIG